MKNEPTSFPYECQHYKGGFYTVLGFGFHSEDLSELVIYQANADKKLGYALKIIFLK